MERKQDRKRKGFGGKDEERKIETYKVVETGKGELQTKTLGKLFADLIKHK